MMFNILSNFRFIKRFLAISLLFLYINSNTELHEIMRFPLLIEHFTEHKRLVGDISFWDFLTMHYSTDVSHDADDNRLPFKDPSHSFTASTLAVPIHKIVLTESQPSSVVSHISSYTETFIASHLSDIFQPPKRS
ncbi:hypothetical protein WSM22_15290 [Cytophagales bacterium WSM2-2]|nr:hypothetical protein WSM22_15290 [Cytophagales bacterium WSM2-2]